MDRRRIKTSRTLHKNLNPSSCEAAVPDSEDIFSSSYQSKSDKLSQRASNTELLRKQTNVSQLFPPDDDDDDVGNIENCNDQFNQISFGIHESENLVSTVQQSKTNKIIIPESSSQSTQSSSVPLNDYKRPGPSKMAKMSVLPDKSQPNNPDDPPKRRKLSGPSLSNRNKNKQDRHIDERRNEAAQNNIELIKFFLQAGISIDADEGQYLIANDTLMVAKKMQQLITSGDFEKQVIIEQWDNYIQDESQLSKLLSPTIMNSAEGRQISSLNNISIVKIMLQVPSVQTEILSSLMIRLNETVVAADSMESVSWTYQLLQQLRFLETIYEPELLTMKFEELLETSPIWFQKELITFIPDIVIDTQHQNIAEILVRLMEVHKDLTNVILTCITNLSLGKESLEELRDKMLKILQDNSQRINKIPAIVKFCLEDCTSSEVYQNVLRVIRTLELHPLTDAENPEEYHTSQTMIVNALKTILILSKDMTKAAIMILESTDNVPKPLDLIILLLLHDDTGKKKKADLILKQHIKCGFYRVSLLNEFYSDYKEIAKDLHLIALSMSSNLLMKSDDKMLTDFATEWFRLQFSIHGQLIHKQREIVEKLVSLMGYNDQTAKLTLTILCKMTENSDEKRYLQTHCNYLRILLEKIEKLDLEEVTLLSNLLHALCASSNSTAETLRDDLFMLLQKQLSCNDSIIKSKGVAGAVMAIKHLATKPELCETALSIFNKVQNGVKNCPRSRGFFYDTLGRIISDTDNIDIELLKNITNTVENEFIDTYMIHPGDYSGELVPTFGLNSTGDLSESCVVNFGQYKYGGIISALLRLMKICFVKVNTDGDLENINILLGSDILMPRDLEFPDTQTLDLMFHCINWYRELINTFVTQKDPLLRSQVSKRLENIMQLQGELSILLTLAETRYQPPLCYFHCFSIVPLNKVEKKNIRKGKKSKDAEDKTDKTNVPEWETWEKGSLLSTKNPMYFRRLDADVLDLFDENSNSNNSNGLESSRNNKISTGQICFIIKELLAVLDNDPGDIYVKNLMHKLPKIFVKLQDIVSKLKEQEDNEYKCALKLILTFITTIFQWKGFSHSSNNPLLRNVLRILASQVDESNISLRSCRDLVRESYRFFESLTEVATQIQLAAALVDTCKVLMKHSETFCRQNKEKQATMAYGFLSLEWPSDRTAGSPYRSAVTVLLQNWMDHEPNPLETVSSILEWLPDEAKKLERAQDTLSRLPTISKLNFHIFYGKIFDGLIKGIKISLQATRADSAKLQIWKNVATNLQCLVTVCKLLLRRSMLLVYVRSMPGLLKLFLSHGMPVLEHNLRHQPDEITGILKLMQGGTRYLNVICVDSMEKKDITLTKYVPAAKSILEQLLYSVKGMLVLNNSSTAFWMGNLVNKNLEGEEICTQTSTSTDEPMMLDVDDSNEMSGDEILSDGMNNDHDSDNDNEDVSMDDS